MKQLDIPLLTARQIEVRVAQISRKGDGLSLLLYKDARTDMEVLDAIFGPMGWQRHHSRDNANCTISVWDDEKEQWVDKEDVGTESNTEAQKGLASDSFKRAGVNWGIGRELYTAPFIWIKPPNCEIKNDSGKYRCNDKFEVAEIGYNDHREINRLVIVNAKTKAPVYEYGTGRKQPSRVTATKPKESPTPDAKPAEKPLPGDSGMVPATDEQKTYIREHASDGDFIDIMTEFGAELENLCEADARRVIKELDRNPDEKPKCTRCGKVITGWVLPDGTTMTASEIIGKSKISYGSAYCGPCCVALKKEAKKRDREAKKREAG